MVEFLVKSGLAGDVPGNISNRLISHWELCKMVLLLKGIVH